MILKNLTQRPLTIVDEDGKAAWTLQPERGIEVEIEMETIEHRFFKGIPVVSYKYTYLCGLPPAEKDVILIVKYAVLKALKGTRADVVAPDTAPNSVLRDEMTGKVKGVKRLQTL